MVKVSILIPCYNNEEWISRSIESALAQTYPNKEVIVYDDGSQDRTVEVIQTFGDRIRWDAGPNRGGNVARNRLLEMAQGDWIQYLDADDGLLPDKVSQQIELIDPDTDVIYGSVTLETWKGDECVDRRTHGPSPEVDIYSQWLDWKLAQTGSVLWRREALQRIGGWNEAYPCCQDNEICFRALKAGLVFRQSNDAGAIYRLWSRDTVSHRDPRRLIKTKTSLLEEMLSWLEETGRVKPQHRRLAGEACFRLARGWINSDVAATLNYVKEMRARNLFSVDPLVAPRAYRILFALFGFRAAERVAQLLRKQRS